MKLGQSAKSVLNTPLIVSVVLFVLAAAAATVLGVYYFHMDQEPDKKIEQTDTENKELVQIPGSVENTTASTSVTTVTETTVIQEVAIDANHFPDKEFRRLLSDKYDRDHDGKLSREEILRIVKINNDDYVTKGGDGPYRYEIEDATGIEYFPELIEIRFEGIVLSSLDMSKNSHLKNVTLFESIINSKAIMFVGQTITLSSMDDNNGGKTLYCESLNSNVVKVSAVEGEGIRTLITACGVGAAKIDASPIFTITVKANDNPIPDYSVKTAVSKSFKNDDSKWFAKIPEISIPGKDTESVNSSIKEKCSEFLKKKYEISYEHYYVEKYKMVVILVDVIDILEGPYLEYIPFNVSIETGKLLTDAEVIKLYGISDKVFLDKVKKIYKDFRPFDPTITKEMEEDIIKVNLGYVSLEYIDPFVGEDGRLCFSGYVSQPNCIGCEYFDYTYGTLLDYFE